jgi:hypothetical protein
MFAHLSRPRRHLNTAALLRRITAALAAAALGLLAWAAAAPAASARIVPCCDDYGPVTSGSTVRVITAGGMLSSARVVPPYYGDYGPAEIPSGTVRVITAGGMPGWQIALIAVAAALAAAAAAVVLDRARASRRSAPSAG